MKDFALPPYVTRAAIVAAVRGPAGRVIGKQLLRGLPVPPLNVPASGE